MAKFKIHKEDAAVGLVLILLCAAVFWLFGQYRESNEVIERMNAKNAQDKARLDYMQRQ